MIGMKSFIVNHYILWRVVIREKCRLPANLGLAVQVNSLKTFNMLYSIFRYEKNPYFKSCQFKTEFLQIIWLTNSFNNFAAQIWPFRSAPGLLPPLLLPQNRPTCPWRVPEALPRESFRGRVFRAVSAWR